MRGTDFVELKTLNFNRSHPGYGARVASSGYPSTLMLEPWEHYLQGQESFTTKFGLLPYPLYLFDPRTWVAIQPDLCDTADFSTASVEQQLVLVGLASLNDSSFWRAALQTLRFDSAIEFTEPITMQQLYLFPLAELDAALRSFATGFYLASDRPSPAAAVIHDAPDYEAALRDTEYGRSLDDNTLLANAVRARDWQGLRRAVVKVSPRERRSGVTSSRE
jgi:hypothetical protein